MFHRKLYSNLKMVPGTTMDSESILKAAINSSNNSNNSYSYRNFLELTAAGATLGRAVSNLRAAGVISSNNSNS